MNILGKISSPQRNNSLYSSQRNLVDDDTSDDIVVGTLHSVKSVSYDNEGLQIEETNVQLHSNNENNEIRFINEKGNDSQKKKNTKVQKTSKDHSKKHKKRNQKEDIELNEIISQESTLSPTISSSRSDDIEEDLNFNNSSESLNKFEDVLVVKKSIDSNNYKGLDESYSLKMKTKKKSKRKKHIDDNIYENQHDGNTSNNTQNDKKKKTKQLSDESDLRIIGVHILKTDVLENHMYLYKPFVKLYIINNSLGSLITTEELSFKKQYYSAITKSYDFSTRRKIIPEWDEILMFNNELINQIQFLSDIIIFFEIVDIVMVSEKTDKNEKFETLCWAFIKPLGNDLSSNMNKKLKLQLYDVKKSDYSENKINVYEWWKLKPWKKYPSTLNVIIMSINKSKSGDALDNMRHNITNNIEDKNLNMSKYITHIKSYTFDKLNMEKRSISEQIEIPNKLISFLNNSDGNTTTLKFSNCGKYLAFSALENHKFIIFIYKIPEFEEITKLSHHKGLVYDICWNKNTSELITSSADNFVYIWNISDFTKWSRKKLHHPSFVYTAKFCKSNENIIVSGCYDKIIRIWTSDSNSDDEKHSLSEELSGHTGYVNALCFMNYNEIFFSGDSAGYIFKWAKGRDGWVKILGTCIEEFNGQIINDLQLFPDNQNMLVVLRNSVSWTVNLTSMSTSTCYRNGIPLRYQIRGCISPCGSFVFISNNIWKSSTGELCAIYNPRQFDHHPIMALDYHPFYNMIAISCNRKGIPLSLCYHINSQIVDLNLGIEVYLPNALRSKNSSTENSIVKNKTSITMNKKMEEFKVNTSSHKNKQSKLWDVLRRMDDLLIKAKQSDTEYLNDLVSVHKEQLKINTVLDEISFKRDKSNSENESVSIVSANLTDFYEKIDKLNLKADLETKPMSSHTGSDSSNNLGTYTLENEKSKKNKKTKKKIVQQFSNNDGSSTLSNAESLEEDQNTYTIVIPNSENDHQ